MLGTTYNFAVDNCSGRYANQGEGRREQNMNRETNNDPVTVN